MSRIATVITLLALAFACTSLSTLAGEDTSTSEAAGTVGEPSGDTEATVRSAATKAEPGGAPAARLPGEKPPFDAALAKQTGADEYGMRPYVLVILKTGPKRMPDGDERTAMFAGHMANIQRLADEGTLVLAGPFMGSESGWRGLFVFAVDDIEQARTLTATDPVIVSGEMVAEYHRWYGSAATMLLTGLHSKIAKSNP